MTHYGVFFFFGFFVPILGTKKENSTFVKNDKISDLTDETNLSVSVLFLLAGRASDWLVFALYSSK